MTKKRIPVVVFTGADKRRIYTFTLRKRRL